MGVLTDDRFVMMEYMGVYVALLRGINVGGNNIIPMAGLRQCFERMKFNEVRTYIQSGNVVFDANDSESVVEEKIEEVLGKEFSYKSTVVVVSADELEQAIRNKPTSFGDEPEIFKYDVIFLKKPLDSKDVVTLASTREGVDEVTEGPGVLYFKRLTAEYTKSKLGKIVSSPIYKQITIRNWNTIQKLWEMVND